MNREDSIFQDVIHPAVSEKFIDMLNEPGEERTSLWVKWDVLQLRRGGTKRQYKDQKCVGEKRHDKKRAVLNWLSSERKGGKQGKEEPADQCIVMHRSSVGIHSEKCVIRRFCHCANIIECTYTNLETWHWVCLLKDESPFRHPFPE